MSWAALANNQTVSFNNLQNAVNTGVFTAKTTIPVSVEQITKTDANTYVNINTSYAPYAAKAANQLVVKSDLVAAGGTTTTTTTTTTTSTTTTTTTAAAFAYGGTANLYKSSFLACNNINCGRTYWLASPSWSVGNTVYDNAALTIPFNGGGLWIGVATSTSYCSGGWAAIQVSAAGIILDFVPC